MSEKSVKRWSAKRKRAVVLRLLHGESLDTLRRESGGTGHGLVVMEHFIGDVAGIFVYS